MNSDFLGLRGTIQTIYVHVNSHWMSKILKGLFIGLPMQSMEKSAERRQKRLRCNWSWANLHRFERELMLEKHTNSRYLNLRCRRRNRRAPNSTYTLNGTAAPHTSPLPSFQTQQNHAVDSSHSTQRLFLMADPVVMTKATSFS